MEPPKLPSPRKDSLPEQALRELCSHFEINPKELTPLEAFENFVYEHASAHILRITHCSHRDLEAVRSELHWVNHLKNGGASIASAVPAQDGREIVVSGDGQHLAVCLEKVPGLPLHTADSNHLWNSDLYREWGRTIGEFHRLTSTYQAGPNQRTQWSQDRYVMNWESFLEPHEAEMLHLWRSLQRTLRELPKQDSNYGLIHADLHAKNFFWFEGQLQVFDTDDCQYHWFIADVASVLLSLILGERGTHDFVFDFLTHFWKGYFSEFQLAVEEVARLPLFLKSRELLLYGALRHKWDFQKLSPRQSQLVERLRASIEARTPVMELDWCSTLP